MKRPLLVLILTLSISIAFLSGCAQPGPVDNSAPTYEQTLIDSCISECQKEKGAGTSLESGPCLLNPMPQNSSWVCDVAHDPRQDVDNIAANQCSAFGQGGTKHFVEVTPDCGFLRKV